MKNKLNILLVVLSSTTAIGLGYYALFIVLINRKRNEIFSEIFSDIDKIKIKIKIKIPSNYNSDTFISSVLEKNELLSPLENLINIQFNVNSLIISIILFIFVIVIYLYFINNGISIFNNYIKGSKFNNKIIILRKVNNKFYGLIFIILGLLLIFCILLNYYISFELNSHLDDYIRVHNHILGIYDSNIKIGESSSKASIIVESIIPLFIINKFKKIPKIIKKGFVFIILGSFYYFFFNYSSNLNIIMHDNIKYIVGLFILFDLWVLSFTLESVIIIYYLNYTDNLLENKIYKLLPNSLKNEISSSKEFNQKEIHTYYIKMILHCIIILTVLIIAEIGFYILII